MHLLSVYYKRAWLNVINYLLYCIKCKIFYSTKSLIFAWTKKVFYEIFINFSIWLRGYSPTCPHPELCNMYKLNLTRLGLFKSKFGSFYFSPDSNERTWLIAMKHLIYCIKCKIFLQYWKSNLRKYEEGLLWDSYKLLYMAQKLFSNMSTSWVM